MNDTNRALLRELRDSAEAQLEAARSLNATALDAATERRHAAVVAIAAGPRPDQDALREQVEAIRLIDTRLIRILDASSRTFKRVLIKPQTTYDRNGRMSEGRT